MRSCSVTAFIGIEFALWPRGGSRGRTPLCSLGQGTLREGSSMGYKQRQRSRGSFWGRCINVVKSIRHTRVFFLAWTSHTKKAGVFRCEPVEGGQAMSRIGGRGDSVQSGHASLTSPSLSQSQAQQGSSPSHSRRADSGSICIPAEVMIKRLARYGAYSEEASHA